MASLRLHICRLPYDRNNDTAADPPPYPNGKIGITHVKPQFSLGNPEGGDWNLNKK